VTTVAAHHTSDLKPVTHLSAAQCPGAQGARGNQLFPITLPNRANLKILSKPTQQ